ncbi:MAG: NUDIX domain-containing protein [Promethearchaeota archaeon]
MSNSVEDIESLPDIDPRELKFIYKQEYWFLSAFINTKNVNPEKKATELQGRFLERIHNVTDDDLKSIHCMKEWLGIIKEMARSLNEKSFKLKWHDCLEYFPFRDENEGIQYDRLGYFEFEVEYFQSEPERKKDILPGYLQELPIICSKFIKEQLDTEIKNEFILLDTENPLFVFAVSNEMVPKEIDWSAAAIMKYKLAIGKWVEIYSGQWPDYNDELYNRRIQGNFSNRKSELHYLRQNSGFIYMRPDNYEKFFKGYMYNVVITNTAKLRSLQFALLQFIKTLDIIFQQSEFMDLEQLNKKLLELKKLRASLQMEIGEIMNEIFYNRRQHYTTVMKKLVEQYSINEILDKVGEKFEILYDTLQQYYENEQDKDRSEQERRMNALNILFGSGILIDIMAVFAANMTDAGGRLLQTVVSVIILAVLIYISLIFIKVAVQKRIKKNKVKRTVDAVIINDKDEVALVKRKYPPFKGQYALPGGFIEEDKKELPEEAVVREVKEETNLDIEVIQKIGVYNKEGRDPRGYVESTAFLCKLKPNTSGIKGGDDAVIAEWMPLKKLEGYNLAFDHEDILRDALKIYKKK